MKIESKFYDPIFYTIREISRQRASRSGNFSISIFSDFFFQRFQSCLNVVEATFLCLLLGTSFNSFKCNKIYNILWKIKINTWMQFRKYVTIATSLTSHTQRNFFEILLNQPELDCIYHFPIDLEPSGRPFDSKSI